jgi:hypothetical protein
MSTYVEQVLRIDRDRLAARLEAAERERDAFREALQNIYSPRRGARVTVRDDLDLLADWYATDERSEAALARVRERIEQLEDALYEARPFVMSAYHDHDERDRVARIVRAVWPLSGDGEQR